MVDHIISKILQLDPKAWKEGSLWKECELNSHVVSTLNPQHPRTASITHHLL